MEFLEVVQNRRSIRAFKTDPVEDAKLQAILKAINLAPSAGNLQAYEVYQVTQPAVKNALAQAAFMQTFMVDAPVVLIFCANPARSADRYGERGIQLYSVQDATIACTIAALAITDQGLGSVWIGAFDPGAVRQAASIPESLIPVAMLPIGYPAENPRRQHRRSLKDLIHPVEG